MSRINVEASVKLTCLVSVLSHSVPVLADLGEVVRVVNPEPAIENRHCAHGVAFDGTWLYVNRCNDGNIYRISPTNGSQQATFDPMIPELPGAMTFDAQRNGLWIGTQRSPGADDTGECTGAPMPIYFWPIGGGTASKMFDIPSNLLNPDNAHLKPETRKFFDTCFVHGLAYQDNDPSQTDDDRLWLSGGVNRNVALFELDGTLDDGFDVTRSFALLGEVSGLVIGGAKLYLADNDPAEVYRVLAVPDTLSARLPAVDNGAFIQPGLSPGDMACDDSTFASEGKTVVWVRNNPQCNPDIDAGCLTRDLITAYEIEPGPCQAPLGACCDPAGGACRDLPQDLCQTTWAQGIMCSELGASSCNVHRIILLDRTDSMQDATTESGGTRCQDAWSDVRNKEVDQFFSASSADSSLSV